MASPARMKEITREAIKRRKRYQHVDDYVYERQMWFYHPRMPGKHICLSCWTTTKNGKCPCGAKTEYLDPRARVPHRRAKRKAWEQFFRLFKPTVLTNPNWWKNRPL